MGKCVSAFMVTNAQKCPKSFDQIIKKLFVQHNREDIFFACMSVCIFIALGSGGSGPSVTMLVYDFSEKGGKILSKTRTEKLEKGEFLRRDFLDFENKGWKYVSHLG